jgi:hypothetical protein
MALMQAPRLLQVRTGVGQKVVRTCRVRFEAVLQALRSSDHGAEWVHHSGGGEARR